MVSEGIFSGVRVVELAQYVFVPGASVLLADQGAEVIHIETIEGDPYRTLQVGDGREIGDVNLAMEQNNRGKKSLALDLKNPEGREALLKLIEKADVFVTSLRPQAIRGLGLDVEDLRARNPKLIYARGNGLGFRGGEAHKAGFDSSAFWARGGMAHVFTRPGQQMTSPRPAFGDHSGSISLAFAIAGALYKRAMTGEATVVETSLLQTATWILSSDLTYSQIPGYQVHKAGRNPFPLMTAYETKDNRILQLMLLNPQPHWPGLCKMLDLETLVDDPRFHDNASRMAHAEELVGLIGEKIGAKTWPEWKPVFDAWDAPWELIADLDDVKNDPQVEANDMIFDMDVRGTPIRLVAGPSQFDGAAILPGGKCSPDMGEHTDALLAEVGYSPQQIEDLKSRGIAA